MPVAGRLADWLGSARLGRLAGLAIAVLPILLWGAGTLAEVIPALLAFGIAGGILDVAINAQAVRLEEAYGRPLMASFHACYSLAGLTGALLGGLLAVSAGQPARPRWLPWAWPVPSSRSWPGGTWRPGRGGRERRARRWPACHRGLPPARGRRAAGARAGGKPGRPSGRPVAGWIIRHAGARPPRAVLPDQLRAPRATGVASISAMTWAPRDG